MWLCLEFLDHYSQISEQNQDEVGHHFYPLHCSNTSEKCIRILVHGTRASFCRVGSSPEICLLFPLLAKVAERTSFSVGLFLFESLLRFIALCTWRSQFVRVTFHYLLSRMCKIEHSFTCFFLSVFVA